MASITLSRVNSLNIVSIDAHTHSHIHHESHMNLAVETAVKQTLKIKCFLQYIPYLQVLLFYNDFSNLGRFVNILKVPQSQLGWIWVQN